MFLIHEKKGYTKILPQHERIEIMIKFIVKLLIFNVGLQLDNNRDWLDVNEEDLNNKGDKDEIFIFLEISIKMIYVICQFLYEN